MAITIILFIALALCIFGIIAKNKTENTENDVNETASEEEDIGDDEYNEVEETFFSEVSGGKEKYQFLKIHNQFDLLFIKSIFQSENIPFYVEFEHISKIRPGMYIGDLGNYTLLYILDENYNDAVELVENYLNTKKTNTEKRKPIRNTAEILFGNWKVPSATDTDGIEILYKNKGL
ncbi:MAG: hypothetical protein LBU99_01660 [Spirochaetaceae bacterium]|jgi:hypothetical protein|nr:hypothetical protein [Spirochaetaceae bacterium]